MFDIEMKMSLRFYHCMQVRSDRFDNDEYDNDENNARISVSGNEPPI